jgi:hypothetical protein
MALKVFRSLWFVSVLAVLAALLYVYAGLPEEVSIQEDAGKMVTVSREALFYGVVVLLLIINVLVYIIKLLFLKNVDFRAWFHGLIITLNIFFIISLFVISLYNSGEQYDFSRTSFFAYGSIGLVLVWIAAWPIYILFKKNFTKASVH